MELPSLPYDFQDAQIINVTFGPRREFTLTLSVVTWNGHKGHPLDGIKLRFGGVENLAEVVEFFATRTQEESELGWLRYDKAYRSKMGDLHFELSFERIDTTLQWHCSSLTVSGPLPT